MTLYYTTKYALTDGIKHVDLEPVGGDGDYLRAPGHWNGVFFKEGRDAFLDRDDAEKAANAARDKKIASLRKQIAKLEKLKFEGL